MTELQRKILIEQLDLIIDEATYARDCLRKRADNDAMRHMIRTEIGAEFLETIRKRQTQ